MADCCAHCVFPGGLRPPGPHRKAPPARPPACFVVTRTPECALRITDCARLTDCRRIRQGPDCRIT
eukprot:5366222-Alexandrium_andersonii.AAC.1